MNANDASGAKNLFRHSNELPHNLVGGIRAVLEEQLFMSYTHIGEVRFVVERVVEAHDEADVVC